MRHGLNLAHTLLMTLPFIVGMKVHAQGDAVTIDAAEFQRLVYQSHLLTQMDEKPELDAALHVLLELQWRNPHAAPVSLAAVLEEATARYRTNAPVHLRNRGFRDEILAAYLESLRQVPARTNFASANLTLLNCFMLAPADYATASAAELIHAGDQRLLTVEETVAQRETLVKLCVQRGYEKPAFGVSMDSLLWPETGALLTHTPIEILSLNAALSNSPTMQLFLTRSGASGDGSVTVSTNELKSLFVQEMDMMHEVIETHRVVHLEILGTKTDLTSYLTNTALIDANAQREAAMKEGQAQRFAAAHAAVMVTGDLTARKSPLLSKHMINVGRSMKGVFDGVRSWNEGGSLMKGLACGNFVAAGLGLVGVFLDVTGPTPEQMILDELADIKGMIHDLSTNMNYRFDRVDQTLNQVLDKLDESIALIADVGGNVDDVRRDLVDVQEDLHRLERHVLSYVNQLYDRGLNLDFNYYLGYEATYGVLMLSGDYNITEANFFTHARNNSVDGLSSPYADCDYTPEGLYWELTESGNGTSNRLDQNLSYIKEYFWSQLGQSTGGALPLANPRDWFVGASAYLQLAVENPLYYRDVNISNRLDLITARGRELTNFLGSLTFLDSSTNVNWSLHNVLLDNYANKLNNFVSQIHTTEHDYASLNNFPLDTWRNWAVAAPRVTTTGTAVMPMPLYAQGVTNIAGGGTHSLALKDDGTVVGWGDNAAGQITIPEEACNVIAIAGGLQHSLALRSDGVVVCWGTNDYNQCIRPDDATNVVAIAAGYFHSLALREDGQVVAWGAGTDHTSFPHYGQSAVPSSATNITSIAAGGYHSLALREDGTLLPWGLNNEGQLNIPESATNVVAIAAGHGHNLVLKSNGTLAAWGNNLFGSTNVPPEATNIVAIAAAGWHCLALRDDGTLFGWGWTNFGQALVPASLVDVQSLAAGRFHSLALKSDGTVVGWGLNIGGQCAPPGSPLGGTAVIAANSLHSVAMTSDGTVVAWGENSSGQTNSPASATNVVAIAAGPAHNLALQADGAVVGWGDDTYGQATFPGTMTAVVGTAAGRRHSLALQADGTVLGWGYNGGGQATGVRNTVSPYLSTGIVSISGQTLSNVVAVSAGSYFSLALKANGQVAAWGQNDYSQTSVPSGAINVVAIAAGSAHSLALRVDGEIIGWGHNSYGQRNRPAEATNVVAIAAGGFHSLALRADGTVVGWGHNDYGQCNPPAEATNVVAIAAGIYHSLALRADGTLLCWGDNTYGQINSPASLRPESYREFEEPSDLPTTTTLTKVAAGLDYSLGLKADGTVLAWGVNNLGQCSVPPGLVGVMNVAAGHHHGVALTTNGSAVAWGWNLYGQTNVPSIALSNVETIAAGGNHTLALRNDGMVRAWGCNNAGQTNIPAGLENVVAIAAGAQHSLALKADSTVVTWGATNAGGVPLGLSNVVAIAAGEWHDLALRDTGEVVAWGMNAYGQTDVPLEAQSGVVAIKAVHHHSLALKADGSVVAWGENAWRQTDLPSGLSNVVAMAAGWRHNVFLTTEPESDGGFDGLEVVRTEVPPLITKKWLREVNADLREELEMAGTLNTRAVELSGAKALIQAVLELGMPYTMERDDVMHGFLYGTEALIDIDGTKGLFAAETNRLATTPDARPLVLEEIVWPRCTAFATRLDERLLDLQATGQPEIPRVAGHTLRLLNLLRDAWATVPPSALVIGSQTNGVEIAIHGEPYAFYTLQDSPNLTDWFDTSLTNLRSVDTPLGVIRIIEPNSTNPEHFYRAVQPLP